MRDVFAAGMMMIGVLDGRLLDEIELMEPPTLG